MGDTHCHSERLRREGGPGRWVAAWVGGPVGGRTRANRQMFRETNGAGTSTGKRARHRIPKNPSLLIAERGGITHPFFL